MYPSKKKKIYINQQTKSQTLLGIQFASIGEETFNFNWLYQMILKLNCKFYWLVSRSYFIFSLILFLCLIGCLWWLGSTASAQKRQAGTDGRQLLLGPAGWQRIGTFGIIFSSFFLGKTFLILHLSVFYIPCRWHKQKLKLV